LREPPRGHFDAKRASGDVPSMGAVLRLMLSKRACLHMMACATLCIFCNNGLNLFLPSFFVRIHGLSPLQAGQYFGVLIGIAAAIGTTGLGLIVSRMGRADPRWYCLGPAIIMVVGMPLYAIAFLVDRFATAYMLLFAATCIGFAFLGPMVGAIQNMVEPRMRASASAILLVAMQLVGGGVGSAFTGWVSDLLARRAFAGDYSAVCPGGMAAHGAPQAIADACHLASATGLREALLVCSLFFLWAAFHAVMASRTLVRDLSVDHAAREPATIKEAIA
jgi:MFS family permease